MDGLAIRISRRIHNALTLADGRYARLPVSIGTKILLRGESATTDTRVDRYRGKVTESDLARDAPGAEDRARACDCLDRLAGIPGGEHVGGCRPSRGVGKRPVEIYGLRAWRDPHRERRIEVVAASAMECPGPDDGVVARVHGTISH